MDIHLKFKEGNQRVFIENIIGKSGLNINALAHEIGVSARNFRDWKREKFSISKNAAIALGKKYQVGFPEDINLLESRWHSYFSRKSRYGGLAYKNKYGSPGTLEGRQKGAYKTLDILRQRGIIPPVVIFRKPKFSEKLAEFMGIMLGDGSVGKLQISITLNSIKDLDYSYYVTNVCESLFGSAPKVRKRKNANALEIYYNGKNLVQILTNLGLFPGNKIKNQVGVPAWIKNDAKYKIACLRGLMDTDGGVFVHKYFVNKKLYKYKQICFTNYSVPLLDFVYLTLVDCGFTPKIKKSDTIVNKKVWLYNSHEIDNYFSVIGSSNLRLNQYRSGGVA